MNKYMNQIAIVTLTVFVALVVPPVIIMSLKNNTIDQPWKDIRIHKAHVDHSVFFTKPFDTPQAVTKACLSCHPNSAKEIMKTAHWTWLGDEIQKPGMDKPLKIGKKNLINNFCIGITNNWNKCTVCHIGYGWENHDFDFKNSENVDCLICHDHSGIYSKGASGWPAQGTDLLAVAKSVGRPKNDNCGLCHSYGGGGMGVKHGDLDASLNKPSAGVDIHMGRHGLECIDCHKTKEHEIRGKSISVSISNYKNGMDCTSCHSVAPHNDDRLNSHVKSVACQTCHIPKVAIKAPTKIYWDWSKAGEDREEKDKHKYMKIKGEFIYEKDFNPEYYWFNGSCNRYLSGEKMNPEGVTVLNMPNGNLKDPAAKIWPFKVHRGKQVYDKKFLYFLQPVTAGKGGYWHEFNWDKSLRLQAEAKGGLPYSGEYDFARTEMYWPLSHMVSEKNRALACVDCHGEKGRMNWKALGYENDPIKSGSRVVTAQVVFSGKEVK